MSTVSTRIIEAWGRPEFAGLLRDELLRGDALAHPLQQGLTHGSHALAERAQLIMLRQRPDAATLDFDVGVSYASVVPGCACDGDPTPMGELPEYATLRMRIDRGTGQLRIELLPD